MRREDIERQLRSVNSAGDQKITEKMAAACHPEISKLRVILLTSGKRDLGRPRLSRGCSLGTDRWL